MTVGTTGTRISGTGNGVTTNLTFPYAVLDGETDLELYIEGVLKTYSTDYTWTPSTVGGTIVTNMPVPNGDEWLIVRKTEKLQPNSIQTVGVQPSAIIEDGLDRIVLLAQESIAESERALRLGTTFTGTFDTELPGTLTANRALLINATADGFELSDYDPDANVAAAAASASAAASSASAASTSASNALSSASAAASSASAASTSASDAAASAASIGLTTKGDLLTRTSSANTRLAVGTNGQVLTADSAESTGVKWATPGVAQSEIHLTGGSGHGSTNTRIRRFTTTLKSVGSDLTLTQSATNGDSITINTTGIYAIHYGDYRTTSGQASVGVSLNSAQLTTNVESITDANRLTCSFRGAAMLNQLTCGFTGWLTSGDVIRAHTDASLDTTTANGCYLKVVRIS